MSFARLAASNVLQFPAERHSDKLPPRLRAALIAGSSAGLWAVIVVFGYYIAGRLV
jgi:hypothetical protein